MCILKKLKKLLVLSKNLASEQYAKKLSNFLPYMTS